MRATLERLELRENFEITKGDRIYLNFNRGKGSFGVMTVEVVSITMDGDDITVEVVSNSGHFSKYDAHQIRRNGFKTYEEAINY